MTPGTIAAPRHAVLDMNLPRVNVRGQGTLAQDDELTHSGTHDRDDAARTRRTVDADEFQALLMGVLSPAYGYALRLTRHRPDAEDLVQDAALNACRSRHTFEAGTNFKAWFFHILTRCLWAGHRRGQRRPSTVDFEDVPDLYVYTQAMQHGYQVAGDDPARALIEQIGSERVAHALEQLPEEFAVVCTLYFMEDFAYQEIADVLDVPVGTVRSRLHRGRRMLQKSLWHVARESGIVKGPVPEDTP